jgi:hypothetical protein
MSNKIKKILKIIFVAADTSGPAYHDLYIPVNYFHKYNLLQCQIVTSLEKVLTSDADIIGFQRQYVPEVLMYVRMAKRNNKVITTICDDNVWNIPPGNPANSVYQGIIIDTYEAILKEVHAVTTSTPYLKELCVKHNPATYIHRNLVEMGIHQFVAPDKDDDEVQWTRILWHGTPHHHDDITLVEPAIKEITNKYPHIKWVFMGYKPQQLAEYCPRNRWEYYEFVPVESFYAAIASLDADLAFAPLTDHPFNWGKTARKAQEFAILGLPMILAPIRTYDDWKHMETAIKPKTNDTEGWIEAFSYMIEAAPEERRRLAEAAYYFIDNNHNIDKFIAERAAVYYKVYNDTKGTDLVLPNTPEWEE